MEVFIYHSIATPTHTKLKRDQPSQTVKMYIKMEISKLILRILHHIKTVPIVNTIDRPPTKERYSRIKQILIRTLTYQPGIGPSLTSATYLNRCICECFSKCMYICICVSMHAFMCGPACCRCVCVIKHRYPLMRCTESHYRLPKYLSEMQFLSNRRI